MPAADMAGAFIPWAKAEAKAVAAPRRHRKQGLWPAASAVTSSAKNSSVQPADPPGPFRPQTSRLRSW